MSETLPIFPLNTVLFPGAPLPLRIFEPRYREMLQACLEGDRRFGVALIKSGQEVGASSAHHDIDSVALRYEGAKFFGQTDEWNVQGFSVEARRGLTLVQYYIGSTPRLWNVLAEQYASPTEFNKSRSETVFLSPYGTTIPTDGSLTVAIRTGNDDFRSGSNAYLRVLLNDGGFVENKLNKIFGQKRIAGLVPIFSPCS